MILDCKTCSALVDAVTLIVYEEDGEHDPENFEPPGRWTFAHCPICKLPMLALQLDFGDGFEVDTPSRMYPARDRQLSFRIPKAIKTAFNEAVTCFRAKAYTASAIMCRKSLEELCAEHGATASNLSASLRKLRDQGIIEKKLFEWAEALRSIGNEAAHGAGTVVTREDAQDTLDFAEALIQYVFTYQDRFVAFQQRRVHSPAQSPSEELSQAQ